MQLVTWFEIPVVDLDRAVAFYEEVFGVELERTVIDGHPLALFLDSDGGASGSLATGAWDGARSPVQRTPEAVVGSARRLHVMIGR